MTLGKKGSKVVDCSFLAETNKLLSLVLIENSKTALNIEVEP